MGSPGDGRFPGAENNSDPVLRTELHLHLEGALTAARAVALAGSATDVPLPPDGALSRVGDRSYWSFSSLMGFLEAFGWATRLLRGPEAYAAVLADLLASLDRQGVGYAEAFVAFGQMQRLHVEVEPVLERLAHVAREHEERGGCEVRFVADATWQWGAGAAERALDAALALRHHRIVGFGMGGDETAVRARQFRRVYRRAQEEGLGVSAHAGEGTSPEKVREALEELGVRRVGHGIAAVADRVLLRELAEEGVVLEVCPTSNERTGVWRPEAGAHPLFTLLEHGVPVVIGSDDPAFFGCTLRTEEARLRSWGLDERRLRELEATAQSARFGA